MHWMFMPLRRYADFSGRSRRREYWFFLLFTILLYAALVILMTLGLFGSDPETEGPGLFAGTTLILFLVVALALLIPTIAVTVRRFHDQDKSGWFYLLNFIPYVGPIVVLVFMCIEGTKGPNRFGDDPKGGANEEIFA